MVRSKLATENGDVPKGKKTVINPHFEKDDVGKGKATVRVAKGKTVLSEHHDADVLAEKDEKPRRRPGEKALLEIRK